MSDHPGTDWEKTVAAFPVTGSSVTPADPGEVIRAAHAYMNPPPEPSDPGRDTDLRQGEALVALLTERFDTLNFEPGGIKVNLYKDERDYIAYTAAHAVLAAGWAAPADPGRDTNLREQIAAAIYAAINGHAVPWRQTSAIAADAVLPVVHAHTADLQAQIERLTAQNETRRSALAWMIGAHYRLHDEVPRHILAALAALAAPTDTTPGDREDR